MHAAMFRRTMLGLTVAGLLGSSSVALAAPMSFDVPLSGKDQVPPVTTNGTGTAHLTYNPSSRELKWTIDYSGLASPVTMAHFHRGAAGANGPVALWLTKKGAPVSSPITGQDKLTPAQAKQFLAGDWYVNIHTKNHPAGAIRGQVVPPKG
jgi:hypothetical protein